MALAPLSLTWAAPPHATPAACPHCGVVQEVHQERRKGEGGLAGVAGGAVIGGLLGNQIGGGTGKTLATIGGAIGGAYVGKEVEKNVTARTVWVTTVRMRDGTLRRYETADPPPWQPGQTVRLDGPHLRPY
ncbi:MAG: glycine zipper 2TM domain-containing protein [Tibeticola sp.]|nr:glycine zipper 2TM domain-containing protein [Tibeticola sp.]